MFWNSGPKASETAAIKVKELVQKHMSTLIRKREQGIIVDEYGVVDARGWNKACQYFMDKVVLPELTEKEIEHIRTFGLSQFANLHLDERVRKEQKFQANIRSSTKKSKTVEGMTPLEFEKYCADLIGGKGWDCSLTKASGDQGVDVVCRRSGKVLVVQCKLYSSPVGNGAVQEVIAARDFMRADYAIVVTNATYTNSAKQLAQVADIRLLHHTELVQLDDKALSKKLGQLGAFKSQLP